MIVRYNSTDRQTDRQTDRESNYDLLRILCAVAAIIIHVSASYVGAITDPDMFGRINLDHALGSSLFNQLSRFAVPCFVMLSGAFLLDDGRNANYSYFYKKSFKSIGITTVVFSVLYFLFSVLKCAVSVYLGSHSITYLLTPIKSWICGAPFYHMWYLYMLIGVYLLIPLIIRFKNDIGEEKFKKVSYIFLAACCAGLAFRGGMAMTTLYWDPACSFCHCGYLLAGYTMRKYTKKSNLSAMLKFLAVIAVLGTSALILYFGIGNEEYEKWIERIKALCQSAGAVLMFSGFSSLKAEGNYAKISSLTFLIYLFHAGIWNVMEVAIKKIIDPSVRDVIAQNSIIFIPAFTLIVFVLSVVCAVIYKKLWALTGDKITGLLLPSKYANAQGKS